MQYHNIIPITGLHKPLLISNADQRTNTTSKVLWLIAVADSCSKTRSLFVPSAQAEAHQKRKLCYYSHLDRYHNTLWFFRSRLIMWQQTKRLCCWHTTD